MSHFEFIIPLQRDDLKKFSAGEYKVEDIVPFDKLHGAVEKCIESFKEDGCCYILDHFDTMYSMLIHFSRVEWSLFNRTFDRLILTSLSQLKHLIEPLVEDVPDPDTRLRTQNILKMNLYIFTQLHGSVHDRIRLENSTTVSEKGKGKRGKKSRIEESGWDWDETQRQAFIALFDLLNLQISKLWDPPVPDEQFINTCANCCYAALEHPSIAHVKSRPLRDTLFQVLGILIKRFSHGISCVVKIVQLLTLHEHVVSPLAHGVVMFVQVQGFKSLVNEIVREVMNTTDNTQKSSSIRSFSNFLIEVAGLDPQIMIPTTRELVKYLEQDPYSMRICVLSVVTEILLTQLTAEELDEAAKDQRDLFLELLEEHTYDTNAFVRSKVLQLWLKLAQHNAIPKSKFLMVMDLGLERIMDSSSNVCKHAITLVKGITEKNPFGVKLDLKELVNQLMWAEEKLNTLERQMGVFKDMSREMIWQNLQPDIVIFLSTSINFAEPETESESQLTQMLTKDSLQENIKTIAVLITNRKYEQAYNLVRSTEKAFPGVKGLKSEMPASNTVDYYLTLMKEIFMMYKPPDDEMLTDDAHKSIVEERNTQQTVVDYLLDCIEFAKKVEESISLVILILNEDSLTEVLEAVSFLTVAYQFSLPSADIGVQQMLHLVFRKEQAVREAIDVAYHKLYLTVPSEMSKKDKAVEEVNRLSKLAGSLNYGQLEALSELIAGWIKSNELDQDFVNVLWDRVKKSSDTFKKQTALVLLSMVTQENPAMAKDQLGVLIERGLNVESYDAGRSPSYTAIFTCRVIANVMICKNANGKRPRYPPEHELFSSLIQIIKKSFTKLDGSEIFIRLAREAINIIAELCTMPNIICGEMLCDLFDIMISEVPQDAANEEVINDDIKMTTDESNLETNPNDTAVGDDIASGRVGRMATKMDTLMRFIFLVGHISFKYGQFLESYYLENLKLKTREQFKTMSPSKNKSKILDSSRRSNGTRQKGEEEIITETDLLAAADDAATDEVRKMLDSEIVNGDGTIAGFSKLILGVCKQPKKYPDPFLKTVAASALAQTMMVSSQFCNEHMQLLVTLLEKTPEESVRLSLVIAFGDLLFKFPNVVEPWTRFLYARLRDESWKVRRNTLLVLSHLVTNEMVKVKGQISEVALCIVDKNEEIVDLAKRFFAELSHKGNTLYNVLPDIISHLSNPESDIVIDEKDFEAILKYIMDQIQKEKQLENLVEKLCKRMKESLYERQWKDLAFCLSLLPWSDRSLRRLVDHAVCYCDRLLHQPVASLFLAIIASVTKSVKPGLKEIGAELSSIVNDVLTKGSADHLKNKEDGSEPAAKTPGRAIKKAHAKTPGTRKKAKQQKKTNRYASDSENDSFNESSQSDEGDNEEKELFKGKASKRLRHTSVKLF